jgi:hypothetical protein
VESVSTAKKGGALAIDRRVLYISLKNEIVGDNMKSVYVALSVLLACSSAHAARKIKGEAAQKMVEAMQADSEVTMETKEVSPHSFETRYTLGKTVCIVRDSDLFDVEPTYECTVGE